MAATLVSVAGSAQPAPQVIPLDSAGAAAWRADLAVLRRELPRLHARVDHALPRAAFDSAIDALDGRLASLARHQVVVELARIVALIGDGHTNVSPWRDSAIAFSELPVRFHTFDGAFAVRAASAATEQAHPGLVGARVLAIGGVRVDSALVRVAPLVARDNAQGVRQWAPVLLAMPEVLHAVGLAERPDRAVITIAASSGPRDITLHSAGRWPTTSGDADRSWDPRPGWVDAREPAIARGASAPAWLGVQRDPYAAHWRPATGTLHIRLDAVQSATPSPSAHGDHGVPPIGTFFARAMRMADSLHATRIVLDLRRNGGGDGTLVRHVLRPLVRSAYDTTGRLVVLTGRRTFSAAQMLVTRLAQYSNAVFVGEPTASRPNHYGDSRRLVLPTSGVTVRVATLWWQFGDPRDTRPWLPVGVAVPFSLDDYLTGRDPVLEAAERIALP